MNANSGGNSMEDLFGSEPSDDENEDTDESSESSEELEAPEHDPQYFLEDAIETKNTIYNNLRVLTFNLPQMRCSTQTCIWSQPSSGSQIRTIS